MQWPPVQVILDYSVIWDFKGGEKGEVQSASLLETSNCLLGTCSNSARIVKVDAKGNIIHEVTIDQAIENPHSQFRQIRKRCNGNYLIMVLAIQ